MRIIYFCPAIDTPIGGIKVLYRQVELLASLGAEAYVLHPGRPDFHCTWFDHQVPRLRNLDLHQADDFVVIPEVWAPVFGPQCIDLGLQFAIFVQNPYIPLEQSPEILKRVYMAANLLLSISEDTERMLTLSYPLLDPSRFMRVHYSINERFLMRGDSPTQEQVTAPCISFMPRKLPHHAELVCSVLRELIPSQWQITPIHNVDEAKVATMLARSRIFLSFSELEGLPLPPLEAALAGNVVVGYTGQGACEYWDRPNFQEVHQGDIRGFIMAANRAVQDVDAGHLTHADLAPGIERLAERFSRASETANMHRLIDRIKCCFGNDPVKPRMVETTDN